MKKLLSFLLICFTLCNAQVPQSYTSFQGNLLNLYKYEGTKTMILADSNVLDADIMKKWSDAMDGTYNFYYSCTGQYPTCYTNVTCINGKSTIAKVVNTCGAGCGYLGTTGIELEATYFDIFYNNLLNNNQYDQVPFYEFGRNFWFYDSKLRYQSNDPIVTGYAVFMRFMAMEYIGVQGANFGSWTFPQFQSNVKGLLTTYMADPNLNWANTLGIGQGVPNSGLGATDLFASFCFYLKDTYGMSWVQNVWKKASLLPNAITTQDAVDNFIIASSQAANVNLVSLFKYWKWTPSPASITFINSTLGVSENTSYANETIAYPNPTTGEVYIDNVVARKVNVYNNAGQLVKTISNKGNTTNTSVQLNNLPTGTYYLNIESEKNVYTVKPIIKQ